MLKKINYNDNLMEITKILKSRKESISKDVSDTVEEIKKDVKENGDSALKKYAKKFDNFIINNSNDLIVSKKEIEEGYKNVSKNFIRILNRTKNQIIEFHKNQKDKSWSIFKEDGVIMGQIVRPLEKVAVYVPGGTASYPSTVMMNVIPAVLAGVKEIIMITPVKENGKVSDSILAAAKVCGINKIYKIGGAQAIGAVTFGTETIPKVDKIVGPRKYFCCYSKKMLLWNSWN